MEFTINLENIIFAYFLVLSLSALTTLFSSTARAFSEYGKQVVGTGISSFLYMSKKKYFGHMYIFAFLLDLFVLYHTFQYICYGHKTTFAIYMSQNAKSVDKSEIPDIRLGYESNCPYPPLIGTFCLVLVLIHTARRAYESFIMAQDSPSKFHFLAYIVGVTYYVGDIFTLAAFTPAFRAGFPVQYLPLIQIVAIL